LSWAVPTSPSALRCSRSRPGSARQHQFTVRRLYCFRRGRRGACPRARSVWGRKYPRPSICQTMVCKRTRALRRGATQQHRTRQYRLRRRYQQAPKPAAIPILQQGCRRRTSPLQSLRLSASTDLSPASPSSGSGRRASRHADLIGWQNRRIFRVRMHPPFGG
jgi:hypothetical protein